MEIRYGVFAFLIASSALVHGEMIDVSHSQVRVVEPSDATVRSYMDRFGELPRSQKFSYAHVFYNLGFMRSSSACEHRMIGIYPRRTGVGMLDGFSESVLTTALDNNIGFVQSLELNIQRFLRDNRRDLRIRKKPVEGDVVKFLITPDVLRIPDAMEEGVFSFLDHRDFVQFGLELTTAVNAVLAKLDVREFPDLKYAKVRKVFLSVNSWRYRMNGTYTLDFTLFGSRPSQKIRLVKRFDATPEEFQMVNVRSNLLKAIAPGAIQGDRIHADVVWMIIEKMAELNR